MALQSFSRAPGAKVASLIGLLADVIDTPCRPSLPTFSVLKCATVFNLGMSWVTDALRNLAR